jgi:hypothetical protein
VQADNIATLIKAANVTVDPYWPGLFAKLFEKTSIDDLLSNIGSGVSAKPPLPARLATPPPRRLHGCLRRGALLADRPEVSSWTTRLDSFCSFWLPLPLALNPA